MHFIKIILTVFLYLVACCILLLLIVGISEWKNENIAIYIILFILELVCIFGIYILRKKRSKHKKYEADRGIVAKKIAEIISCEFDSPISLEILSHKLAIPPESVGEYVSTILFDVLNDLTSAQHVLSERQEKKIKELVTACGATLSKDMELQLAKQATIRDIICLKADPREFVRRSLLVK